MRNTQHDNDDDGDDDYDRNTLMCFAKFAKFDEFLARSSVGLIFSLGLARLWSLPIYFGKGGGGGGAILILHGYALESSPTPPPPYIVYSRGEDD